MTTEPKVRRDGRCVVCRKPIETTPRPGLPAHIYIDPFCSSLCAKSYYGVETSLPLPKGRARYLESEGAE